MRKSKNYWNKDSCENEAKKFTSRSEFKKKSGGAYNKAKKMNILNEICSHMIPIGNRFNRLVYIFKFPDNSIYVGLTKNIEERKSKHFRDEDSAVFKHILKTNIYPDLVFTNYLPISDAVKLESETIENYRSSGYTILNVAKAGAVGGGNLIWNFEACKIEALKYKNRKEFYKKNNSAYNSARINKWLESICTHMTNSRIHYKNKNYWTFDTCKSAGEQCISRYEFYKKYPGAYMASLKNNWLNIFYPKQIK